MYSIYQSNIPSIHKPTNQSFIPSTNQSIIHFINQSIPPFNQPINHSFHQSTNQPMNHPFNQTNQSITMKRYINQPVNHLPHQSINPLINSMNQPIIQSFIRSAKSYNSRVLLWMFFFREDRKRAAGQPCQFSMHYPSYNVTVNIFWFITSE